MIQDYTQGKTAFFFITLAFQPTVITLVQQSRHLFSKLQRRDSLHFTTSGRVPLAGPVEMTVEAVPVSRV